MGKGAARSKVVRDIDARWCPAVMGRGDASCRQDVGNGAPNQGCPSTFARARSTTKQSTTARSWAASRSTTRSGHIRRWGRGDRSSCTARIHTHFAAKRPEELAPYTVTVGGDSVCICTEPSVRSRLPRRAHRATMP